MLRRAGLLAALTALLVPAIAGTAPADAAKRKKKRSPVVTSISPKNVFVGEKLTIRGRHFRRGVNKNTVAFKRKGAKVVFVKADKGTTKMLSVTLPKRLEKILVVENGTPVPTRLQVRVLAARFGKRFTKLAMSPVVGPERPPAPPKPKEVDPNGDCDGDKVVNRNDADDDNDLLADDLETSMKLDPCVADHDADGVSDGYEYASAQDLNDDEFTNVPYPRKLPYPNPLDGTDGNTDHDGDALTLKDEFDLWKVVGNLVLEPLSYSAGEQYSVFSGGGAGVRQPSLAANGYDKQVAFLTWAGQAGYATVALSGVGSTLGAWPDDVPEWWEARTPYDIRDMDRDGFEAAEATYFDRDRNGLLSDAERDEDADGLSNWAETTGCLTRKYWDELYDGETTYPLQYAPVRLDDPDSDGDGVRDGADDQDHDDVPNVMECSRTWAAEIGIDNPTLTEPPPGRPWKGFVNPFNPCLPHHKSRTCKRIVPVNEAWAPFNPDEKYYFIKN
jgi:IPT/TIG domain